MSDKKNIEKVLLLLEEFKKQIDEQISNYKTAELKFEAAEIEGNGKVTKEMKAQKSAMKAAREAITSKIAAIDRLIFEQSEGKVTESLGVKDSDDVTVKDLNDKIAKILESVKEAKGLGMKTDDGKDVDVKFETGDTLDRLEELDATKKPRDYSKIDDEIAALEAVAIDEEQYKKFNEIRENVAKRTVPPMDLEDVDVIDIYKKEIAAIEGKIAAYKTVEDLSKFDSNHFKTITNFHTFTNSSNKPLVEQWFKLLKSVRGTAEVTVGTTTFKIEDIKDAEEFISKFKGLTPKQFKKAMSELSGISKVSKDELKSKGDEIKAQVSASTTMELFAKDKTDIETVLSTEPIDLSKLEMILKAMKDPDKENIELLNKMNGDPAEIAKAKKELDNLRKMQAAIKKEADAKAATVVAKEIGKFKIGKTEIELKKDEYDGNFVDLQTREDYNDVVEATYSDLPIVSIKQLNDMVEKESKANGDRLPIEIPFFSKFFAQFRADKMTAKERAIAARVKGKIRAGIKSEQKASNRAATELHERDAAEATQAKNDLFRVDQETIDRIDATARKYIIDHRGQTTVREARDEAARDEEK